MKDYLKNLVLHSACIVEAMEKLNDVPGNLTLFVIDDEQRMIGTLTDGDIRRGFIKGLTLNDPVSKFMSNKYTAIKNGFNLLDFKIARERGVKLLPVLDEEQRISKVYDLKKRKSILPVECMIMAGGRGERLRPLTDSTPKPMLLLGGKPILEHNIDRLITYGIEKIYISVKYLSEQIVDYFGDGSAKGISIQYIYEDEPLGTAGALSLVKDFTTEHILMMNSDLFTDADFEDLYLNVIEQKAVLGVATVSYTTKVPYGIFKVDQNQITGLREKPTFTNYANAGIYIFNKSIIKKIPPLTFFNITDLMSLLIADKQLVIHNPIVGYWIDIGQHQDYINAIEIAKHLQNN